MARRKTGQASAKGAKGDPAEGNTPEAGTEDAVAATPHSDDANTDGPAQGDGAGKDLPDATDPEAVNDGGSDDAIEQAGSDDGTGDAVSDDPATEGGDGVAAQSNLTQAASDATDSVASDSEGLADQDTPDQDTADQDTADQDQADTLPASTADTAIGGEDGAITPDAQDISDESAERDRRAASTPPPPATVAPPPGRSGPGFVPLVLGGLVAGAIGWAIATFGTAQPEAPMAPEIDLSRVDAVERNVARLEASLADAPAPEAVDLSPLETAQSDLVARLDDLAVRIEALELAGPPEDGGSAAEALAGLRGEMAGLAGGLDDLRAEIGQAAGDLEQSLVPRIEALEETADQLGDAEVAAEAAMRRASTNEMAIAVRDGLPYPEAAAALGDLPDVLAQNAETGLPTTADLAAAFPALSRAALAEARASGEGEAGLGGFARSLLSARSLEPREGDDPDAVLSRAEAAVRAGDLDTALAEIEALPPEAAAVLDDWAAQARLRAQADAALQAYLEG